MAPHSPKDLTVYVFNVGQGDHLLIELPNGEYGIIDFYHDSCPPLNLLKSPALYFLERRRLAAPSRPIKIRFIHLTHPDLDHTKGVIEFLDWVIEHKIKLREFWSFPGFDFKGLVGQFKEALASLDKPNEELMQRAQEINNRLERLHELIRKSGCREKVVLGVCQMAAIGKDTKVVAVGPLGTHVDYTNRKVLRQLFSLILEGKASRTSYNNRMSSVMMIKYKRHSLLFGGDTGNAIWDQCLEFYRDSKQNEPHGECHGNFIKVSHHGSKNSSSSKLWRSLLQDDTRLVISAGRTKKPKHPDAKTLKEIVRAGRKFSIPPNIVSTNMCSECLNQTENSAFVNWFSRAEAKPKKDVETVNRRMRAKGVSGSFSPPEFAGYIYGFGQGEERIKLTAAVTTKKLTKSPCLWKKPKEGFPKCVYR